MGNRVSIQFEEKLGAKSIAFFSHWDGESLKEAAEDYVNILKDAIETGDITKGYPLYRLECNTVMINFIRYYLKDEGDYIESNYYSGNDEWDGDNSDNGNFIIKL